MIFIDSADSQEIYSLIDSGLISGITTNPKLLTNDNMSHALELYKNTGYKISYQPKTTNPIMFASQISKVFEHKDKLILKIPPCIDCFGYASQFIKKGLDVNVTLVFSVNQAILAGNIGAKYVSVFVGRLEDRGDNPFEIIQDIRKIYDMNNIKTKIIAASIRNVEHAQKSAVAGAHISTISPKIIRELFNHELTEKGIADFAK